jgi:chromosome segregation ATPase
MKNYLEDMHSFEIRVKDYLATDPVRENLHFHSQLSKLEEELENTKSENISLKNENRSLNKQVLGLEEKVNSLKDEVKTMYHTIKDTFTRGLKGNVEQVKLFMSDLAEAIEEKLPENEFSRENEREKKQDRVQERKRNGGRSR